MKETLESNDLDENQLGTGFWIADFGTVDMYFKPDIPCQDIVLCEERKEDIRKAALRAVDILFRAIDEVSK